MIIQAHTYNINDPSGEQRNPKSIFGRSDTVQFLSSKEDRQLPSRLLLLFHLPPSILPFANVRKVYLGNYKIPLSPLTRLGVIILYFLRLERKITLPSTFLTPWEIIPESTPKKLIYSTSRSTTTFQDGILSSKSLIKPTQRLPVQVSTSTWR